MIFWIPLFKWNSRQLQLNNPSFFTECFFNLFLSVAPRFSCNLSFRLMRSVDILKRSFIFSRRRFFLFCILPRVKRMCHAHHLAWPLWHIGQLRFARTSRCHCWKLAFRGLLLQFVLDRVYSQNLRSTINIVIFTYPGDNGCACVQCMYVTHYFQSLPSVIFHWINNPFMFLVRQNVTTFLELQHF